MTDYPVNDEVLVRNYLKNRTDVSELVGTRISTTLPAGAGQSTYPFPFIRLQRISGRRRDNNWLDQGRIQIEAWSDEVAEAFAVMNVVRGAMNWQEIAGLHDQGVVTDSQEVSYGRLDDSLTGWVRYMADFIVRTHPAPTVVQVQTVQAGSNV